MVLFYFGSFNPITSAHISLAKNAMNLTNADKVIFIPASSYYLKKHKDKSLKDNIRIELLNILKNNNNWMEVSDIEIKKDCLSYTYESLKELSNLGYSGRLLLGSDNLLALENKWKYVSEICKEFGIICMQRGHMNVEKIINESNYLSKLKNYIQIINYDNKYQKTSATNIRIALYKKQYDKIEELLPSEVLNYLKELNNEEIFL